MNHIEIIPLALETDQSTYTRRCHINRFESGIQINQRELWYQFDKIVTPPADNDCDSYVLATIMSAMKENRDIYVKGTVSKYLLSNLVEYQAAWNKWLPDLYHCINIQADSLREDELARPGAICAFSGGVDATFSVWRHTQNKYSYRSQDIKLCTLVHGFDIPLTSEAEFENARDIAQDSLNDLQLKLVPIRTNYREIANANWEHAFACALVAALINFKNVAGTCIIGSGKPYDSLIIPWGSLPITDHLLSSGNFHVIHDGASHNRTEKVKQVAEWEIGSKNLRVCWKGALKDRNCGKCEKCVRTKMNFLASGNPIPSCFPESDILEDLKDIVIGSPGLSKEWQQIYLYAQKNNVNGPWLKQLSEIANRRRNPLIDYLLPVGSTRRKVVKNLARKMR